MRKNQVLGQRGWWVSFVLLLATALVVSTLVGGYLARLSQPAEVGQARVGEWMDLADQGFRARVDSIELSPAFPSSYDPEQNQSAPEGLVFLRVRMTVEPLVDPDATVACTLKLFNGEGEELTLTESGIDGPEYSDCLFPTDEKERVLGEAYQTQTVWAVIEEPVQSFTLQLQPLFQDQRVYWSISS